jgi:hypothetical protein
VPGWQSTTSEDGRPFDNLLPSPKIRVRGSERLSIISQAIYQKSWLLVCSATVATRGNRIDGLLLLEVLVQSGPSILSPPVGGEVRRGPRQVEEN